MEKKKPLHSVAAVWAKVPTIACKGLCAHSCGPVLMSNAEWAVMRSNGLPAPVKDCLDCPALAWERCSLYDVRPLICRLWGVVDRDGMRCPHGCQPERWLTDDEAHDLLTQMTRAGGGLSVESAKATSIMMGT